MRPISDLLPKELLPLGTRPVLDFVLEEASLGGIESVGLVVRDGKETIANYVNSTRPSAIWNGLEIVYIDQPEPMGLGDAILRAQDYLAGEPFALMLPDNVALAPEYRLADLLDLHEEKQAHVLGILQVDHSQSGMYGHCGLFDGEDLDERTIRLDRIHDKERRRIEVAPGQIVERTCGRSIGHTDFVRELAAMKPQVEGDFDEVPVVQKIVRERGAWGLRLPSPLFDVGNPRGYLAASSWLFHQGAESLPNG